MTWLNAKSCRYLEWGPSKKLISEDGWTRVQAEVTWLGKHWIFRHAGVEDMITKGKRKGIQGCKKEGERMKTEGLLKRYHREI